MRSANASTSGSTCEDRNTVDPSPSHLSHELVKRMLKEGIET